MGLGSGSHKVSHEWLTTFNKRTKERTTGTMTLSPNKITTSTLKDQYNNCYYSSLQLQRCKVMDPFASFAYLLTKEYICADSTVITAITYKLTRAATLPVKAAWSILLLPLERMLVHHMLPPVTLVLIYIPRRRENYKYCMNSTTKKTANKPEKEAIIKAVFPLEL